MTDQQPFGARLRAAMDGRGPLCAGIDPHAGLLDAWGLTDSVNGLEKFALAATEALAPEVAAVKPQSAFFERFGSGGIEVLERVIDHSRGRCPRGPRREAGRHRLDRAGLRRRLPRPALPDRCRRDHRRAVPRVRQPRPDDRHRPRARHRRLRARPDLQPGGAALPARPHRGGRSVAGTVLAELAGLNRDVAPMGSFGAVVGATIEDTDEDLAINGPLLVPGIGAQGGTADDVRRIFGSVLDQVLPSSSREILGAGPDAGALHEAVGRSIEAFTALRTG